MVDEGGGECASPEEGGSNAEDHRASLMARVPAVVHIPYDRAVRGHYGACSGGGNTQEEHHLAAQELSYTGAQDFSAISLSMKDRTDRSYMFLIVRIELFDNNHKQDFLNLTTSAPLDDLCSL